MSAVRHHSEWLSLIEVSGPFLSIPVLLQAFPQGLDVHDPELLKMLRLAYEEWNDNQQGLQIWKGGDDEVGFNVTQRAVKLSTSVVPASEVPKTSPPNVSEIPQLAGLVLDMKELSQTPTADFAMKLSPLVTAYASWIEDEEKRRSNPNEGLADYQDAAKRAIAPTCQSMRFLPAAAAQFSM